MNEKPNIKKLELLRILLTSKITKNKKKKDKNFNKTKRNNSILKVSRYQTF